MSRVFAGHGQQDAAEFLGCLLDQLRQTEYRAFRFSPWRGVSIADGAQVATQVDRLAGYVEEKRSQCVYCGQFCATFQREFVLSLYLPDDDVKESSITDLYLMGCALGSENGEIECSSEVCQGHKRKFTAQRRVASLPNVLFVQVRRTRKDGCVSRFRVAVEDQFSLPGLGVLELAGVVYHSGGASYKSGHYTCAARAPDRMFWYFDDAATPRRLGENIADFKSECVSVLAYVRPGGEAKYAGVPVEVADSEAGAAAAVDPVPPLHRLVAAAVGVKSRGDVSGQKGAAVTCGGSTVGATGAGVSAQSPSGLEAAAESATEQAAAGSAQPPVPGNGAPVVGTGATVDPADDFTPVVLDLRLCLARTWNGGRGGQCPKKQCVGKLCQMHARRGGLAHGLVTGPVPPAKLREFQQNARQNLARVETPRAKAATDKRSRPSPAAGSPADLSSEKRQNTEECTMDVSTPASGSQHARKRDRPSPPAGASPAQPAQVKVSKDSRVISNSLPVLPAFPDMTAGSAAPAPVATPVYDMLQEALVGGGLWQGVLAELERTMGRDASDHVNAQWSAAWVGWGELLDVVCTRGGVQVSFEDRFERTAATLRKFLLLVAQNQRATLRAQSDRQRWAQLEAQGFRRGIGQVWGQSDCCADSLLQLLVDTGVLDASITEAERQAACVANRQALCRGPLFPRNLHGRRDDDAYLEHDRHAEAIVQFFMQRFQGRRCKAIPVEGIDLMVFSRFDSEQIPVARSRICATTGVESDGRPLVFRLYNSTGDGIRGFHYDPVFDARTGVAEPVPPVSNAEGREGKGREDREGGTGPRRSGRLKRKDGGSAAGKRGDATSGSGTGGGVDASGPGGGQIGAFAGFVDEAAAVAATALPVAEFRRLIAHGGEVKTLRGINIQRPWARKILEGRKTIEARKYPLKGYKGEDLWIIETRGDLGDYVDEASDVAFMLSAAGGGGAVLRGGVGRHRFKSRIVGVVRFEEDFEYHGVDQWRSDVDRHCITSGHFDWDPRRSKMYAWRVASARLLVEPQAEPVTKGMVGATATSRVALFAAASFNAAGPEDARC